MEQNKTPNDDESVERLLEELQRRVYGIETSELLSGNSVNELAQKGFLGEKEITVERSKHIKKKLLAGFVFPPNVHYTLHKPVRTIADIDDTAFSIKMLVKAEGVSILRVVTSEQQGWAVEEIFGEEYVQSCNFFIQESQDSLEFLPSCDGWVVLAGEQLYMVPFDKDGSVSIQVSNDKMIVWMDVIPARGDGLMPDEESVLKELALLGVTNGINRQSIAEGLKTASTTQEKVENFKIAEGCWPQHGKDAQVTYFFEKEDPQDYFTILPDGRIDYRKQASILMTHKEEVLAKVTAPTKGTPGETVYGDCIEGVPGKKTVLCAGLNVIVNEEGEFIALCDGQVSLNKDVLSVFEHYMVEGNVDYTSGNIRFNGNVTIRGNIQPGFEVFADGDVVVMGDVEGAVIKAGRDIRVSGGIIGKGSQPVSAGRDIYAKHVQNACVEAQCSIIIKNSIVQSMTKAGDFIRLISYKSSVLGGELCALRGIVCGNIGSDYGVRTHIEAGNDYLIQKKAKELQQVIKFYTDNIKKIDDVMLSIKTLLKKGIVLSKEKKDRYRIIQQKHAELCKYRDIMKWKHDELKEQSTQDAKAFIIVKGELHTDVHIKILDKTFVNEKSEHKVKIQLSDDQATIHFSKDLHEPQEEVKTVDD
jgi:uncharacterized protein